MTRKSARAFLTAILLCFMIQWTEENSLASGAKWLPVPEWDLIGREAVEGVMESSNEVQVRVVEFSGSKIPSLRPFAQFKIHRFVTVNLNVSRTLTSYPAEKYFPQTGTFGPSGMSDLENPAYKFLAQVVFDNAVQSPERSVFRFLSVVNPRFSSQGRLIENPSRVLVVRIPAMKCQISVSRDLERVDEISSCGWNVLSDGSIVAERALPDAEFNPSRLGYDNDAKDLKGAAIRSEMSGRVYQSAAANVSTAGMSTLPDEYIDEPLPEDENLALEILKSPRGKSAPRASLIWLSHAVSRQIFDRVLKDGVSVKPGKVFKGRDFSYREVVKVGKSISCKHAVAHRTRLGSSVHQIDYVASLSEYPKKGPVMKVELYRCGIKVIPGGAALPDLVERFPDQADLVSSLRARWGGEKTFESVNFQKRKERDRLVREIQRDILRGR